MTEPKYDLFLSYGTPDRDAVAEVRGHLETLGVKTFFDRADLNPGRPWPRELEDALLSCRGVAVFVGSRPELGSWQLRESWMALDLQARAEKDGESFPVVPVLLPGCTDPQPAFLFLNSWVDLRRETTAMDGVGQLVRALREPATDAEEARPEHPEVCPFRGLEPFRRQDQPFFFGREQFTAELVEKVLVHDLVAVVGASGSGKSSVVQAGLLPALGRHREGRAWEVATMRPGDRPFHALALKIAPLCWPDLDDLAQERKAERLGDQLEGGRNRLGTQVEKLLAASPGSTDLLLVVDQFEELFRETPEALREPFIELLLRPGDRCRVVLTLRADFYGHALDASRDLADRLALGQINIGPLTPEEIERVVRGPAERVGLRFADELLPNQILRDAGGGHGALPLLEFCLQELWRECRGGPMTHEGYEAIGRVGAALAGRAERALERLGPALAPAAERLFTDRLVRLKQEGEMGGDTRRRAALDELTPDERLVADAFSHRDARLLVLGETSVEIAHEALIERWETLRGWLNRERSRLLAQQLAQMERAWEEARGAVILDGRFLEEPRPFLDSLEEGLYALAIEPSPFTRLAESLWRLDYLTAKAASPELRRRSRDLHDRLVRAFRAIERSGGLVAPEAAEEELVLIDPGRSSLECGTTAPVECTFCMGSEKGQYEDERPVHPVTLTAFRLQALAVTHAEYQRFEPAHGAPLTADNERLPVTSVSWSQAYAYAAWLGGRLPTEAEWECACRAGSRSDWSFGDEEGEIGRYAWVDSNSGDKAHPVGELEPNDFGLYDMHGNVWEWVADLFGEYSAGPAENPFGPPSSPSGRRVLRGGSFLVSADNARSAFRDWDEPECRNGLLGFRVVLPAPCRDSTVDPGS